MEYFKLTWAYLFKNGKGKQFFVFSAFVFIPCAIIAYFFPLSVFIGWLAEFYSQSVPNWSSLWLGLFPIAPKGYYLIAFAFIFFIISEAAISTMISRHLRVGRFSTKGTLLSVNENFFPALYACIGFALFSLFAYTVMTLFLYMFYIIKIKIIGLVCSILSVILLGTFFIYIWATTNLWLPVMSFNGLNLFKSFYVAFYKSRISQKKFFIPFLVIVCSLVAFGVGAYMLRMIWIVSYILTTLSYIFASVFIVSFNFISYFKMESIPREDLARLYRSK